MIRLAVATALVYSSFASPPGPNSLGPSPQDDSEPPTPTGGTNSLGPSPQDTEPPTPTGGTNSLGPSPQNPSTASPTKQPSEAKPDPDKPDDPNSNPTPGSTTSSPNPPGEICSSQSILECGAENGKCMQGKDITEICDCFEKAVDCMREKHCPIPDDFHPAGCGAKKCGTDGGVECLKTLQECIVGAIGDNAAMCQCAADNRACMEANGCLGVNPKVLDCEGSGGPGGPGGPDEPDGPDGGNSTSAPDSTLGPDAPPPGSSAGCDTPDVMDCLTSHSDCKGIADQPLAECACMSTYNDCAQRANCPFKTGGTEIDGTGNNCPEPECTISDQASCFFKFSTCAENAIYSYDKCVCELQQHECMAAAKCDTDAPKSDCGSPPNGWVPPPTIQYSSPPSPSPGGPGQSPGSGDFAVSAAAAWRGWGSIVPASLLAATCI